MPPHWRHFSGPNPFHNPSLVYLISISPGCVFCHTLALVWLASLSHSLEPTLPMPTDAPRLSHRLLLYTEEISGLSLGFSICFHLLWCRLCLAARCVSLWLISGPSSCFHGCRPCPTFCSVLHCIVTVFCLFVVFLLLSDHYRSGAGLPTSCFPAWCVPGVCCS